MAEVVVDVHVPGMIAGGLHYAGIKSQGLGCCYPGQVKAQCLSISSRVGAGIVKTFQKKLFHGRGSRGKKAPVFQLFQGETATGGS
jgi:hypothetical protein